MKNPQEFFKPEDIEFFLANTPQITFEVTDACNLKCTYCGYGDLYSSYDARENKKLSVDKAILLIDYVSQLWKSFLNISYKKNVHISFYGGEPLLNIDFIRKIVQYVKCLNIETHTFTFAMTTNAILLHKYMDFLVDHDFHTLISLDGNRENTGYRIDKKNKPAFDLIIKNIDLLRDKYPEYFKKRIEFNAVLHNRNSVESIYEFFKKKYDKVPRIAELNNSGIREDKKEEYEMMYRNTTESLNQSEHYTEIMKDTALSSGTFQSASSYLWQYSNSVYRDYRELLYGKPKIENRIPTGTCMPFSKKIFVTVNGKLLPCERIGHQYSLGQITDEKVNIDFEYIANKYNQYYEKLSKQCKSCHNKRICYQCVYNLPDIDTTTPQCHGHMNKKEFEIFQRNQYDFFMKNPEEYFRMMEEIIIS